MSVVDVLLENAKADVELLRLSDSRGDVFSRPRDVDFLFVVPSKDKGSLIAGFVNDNQYGKAAVQVSDDGSVSVLVTVNMPIEQNVIHSVSGLMACIAALFGVTYDGWGCVLKNAP